MRFAKLSINRIVRHFFLGPPQNAECRMLPLLLLPPPVQGRAQTPSRNESNRIESRPSSMHCHCHCRLHVAAMGWNSRSGPSKSTCIMWRATGVRQCYFSLCGCALPVTTFAHCRQHNTMKPAEETHQKNPMNTLRKSAEMAEKTGQQVPLIYEGSGRDSWPSCVSKFKLKAGCRPGNLSWQGCTGRNT